MPVDPPDRDRPEVPHISGPSPLPGDPGCVPGIGSVTVSWSEPITARTSPFECGDGPRPGRHRNDDECARFLPVATGLCRRQTPTAA